MDKIVEALSKLLPDEDARKEIAEAVQSMFDERVKELEKEYSDKLEEAYAELSEELKQAEQTAESGYQDAFAVIKDLRDRLNLQRAEFEAQMDEGYEEAFQMLQGERSKNENLEIEMYDQFNEKLKEMKEYMVDKVHEFLEYKGQEIYEQARRDVLNDPRYAEHKVTLDRVVQTVEDYISDEDFANITNRKLAEAEQAIKELRDQNRILESRNIRLSTDNKKLDEVVRQSREQLLKESSENNKQEREEKAQNAKGRGRQVTEPDQIVAEYNNPKADGQPKEDQGDTTLVESLSAEGWAAMNILAGTKQQD